MRVLHPTPHWEGSYDHRSASQNDLRLHFGSGSATKVDKVEIHWPSGLVEDITNLASDRYCSVIEGKGVVP